MQQKYAKDQPAGFTNRIERVAIVGASGQVGSHMTAALLSTGKHTVTALTRSGGNSKMPAGVTVAAVDYDREETLVDALRGQQFLIISISVLAPPESQTKLIKAAAKAGVAWVMPNCYGTDVRNAALAAENLTGPAVLGGIEAVEREGVSSWVAMCCSFWYEFSLSMGPGWYGFDFAGNRVTLIDDGKTRINTSTWEQCGRAIKSLLTLKELPEDEADTSLTLSRWRNQPLYISSFLISQRDMLDSVNRVAGTSDADWQIEHEESQARYRRGFDMFKQGSHLGFGIALYTRTFFPNGDGNFQDKHGLANEALGLPEESLDEATKRALGMIQGGFQRKPQELNLYKEG
ncbi:nmrA-like family protein [Hirsutella rhossiliensis]|uniref:NmrA-like family domain-containing protein n=1 Tax=Hirsutella rhossiliensis TaxID=111463 RepID=A0A9P8MX11_9HYPO|nr:nmrA-like family domain-containing protein [Hirsutella rhossiliensis]KAH0962815.1 nmrA-like family domain-containing protein [Hirsutella rhossiliensis]